MQKLPPAIRSAAAYAPSEAVDGRSHPSPVKSSLEGAGSAEDNCAKFMESHALSRAINIFLAL